MLTQIPHGLDEIIHLYGSLDDSQFESKHLTRFDLPYQLKYEGKPVTTALCHMLAVENFIKAFKNIEAAGLANQFVEYNGIYARRAIRGQNAHASLHSWGVAIDMGASTHPLGKMVPWPQGIVEAFADAGFFWGGNFKSRKDCMHFQLATGY